MQDNGTEERINSPTPNGGDYSIARYYDHRDMPAKKNKAKKVIITEYSGDDKVVFTTYGEINTSRT